CLVLTLPCLVWVWLERRWIEREAVGDLAPGESPGAKWNRRRASFAFHRFAPPVAIVTLAFTAANMFDNRDYFQPWLAGAATLSTAAAVIACLWDRRARHVMFFLYALGLVAIAQGLAVLHPPRGTLLVTAACLVGAYAIGTSYLWSRRQGLLRLAERL